MLPSTQNILAMQWTFDDNSLWPVQLIFILLIVIYQNFSLKSCEKNKIIFGIRKKSPCCYKSLLLEFFLVEFI